MHGSDVRKIALVAGTDEHGWRTALFHDLDRHLLERHEVEPEALVKRFADLREQRRHRRPLAALAIDDLLHDLAGEAATAQVGRREHGADPGHPDVLAVQPRVEAIPLRGREQPILLVDQREPVEMLASPWRPQLRCIPALVAGRREALVPDRVGEIENAVEKGAFGKNQAIWHE